MTLQQFSLIWDGRYDSLEPGQRLRIDERSTASFRGLRWSSSGIVRGLCHGAYMCVCLRSLWDSPRSRVLRSGLASEALRVVLRGFVVLPLLTQGQLYAVYLFFTTLHRRRWVSLTYHEARRSGGPRPPCHRRVGGIRSLRR